MVRAVLDLVSRLGTVRRKPRTYRRTLWSIVSMLGTVRRKAGINVQRNLMVPAVLHLVGMLGTVRKKAGLTVRRNIMVPAVLHLVSILGTTKRKSKNVQKDFMVHSRHAWNSEKEKQQRTD